jgi:hypothetical protein
VGALESVVHGLHAWMLENAYRVPELRLAADSLAQEEVGNPYMGLPPYMDERLSKWHTLLGYIGRDMHLRGEGVGVAEVFARMSLGGCEERDG